MKRISSIILTLMIMFVLFSFSTVSAEVTSENSRLMKDKPESFQALGFPYEVLSDEIPPFHRLQNLMEFEFINGTEIQRQFTIEYSNESIYGPAVHKLDLNLIYDRTLLQTGGNFIAGTFSYYWNRNGEVNEYRGTITGGILEVSTDIMGFDTAYDYTNALALDLAVEGNPWEWTIYLEVPGEENYYIGSTYIDEDYASSGENPHVPSPGSQADVAAGIGISTVGIALINALTKTSVLGGNSINLNTNTTAARVQVASEPVSHVAASSDGGNIFSVIGDFFKNLFSNLRDMFTDEGRSYASGKVSDFLEDSDFNDSADDN